MHDGEEVSHEDVRELRLLMRSATFANDAQLIKPSHPGEKWKISGDPTEAALLVAAHKMVLIGRIGLKTAPYCRASLRF
jgi:hypothetical protein